MYDALFSFKENNYLKKFLLINFSIITRTPHRQVRVMQLIEHIRLAYTSTIDA